KSLPIKIANPREFNPEFKVARHGPSAISRQRIDAAVRQCIKANGRRQWHVLDFCGVAEQRQRQQPCKNQRRSPRQTPDPSFSEKPGSPSLTPQINLSLERTSSMFPRSCAERYCKGTDKTCGDRTAEKKTFRDLHQKIAMERQPAEARKESAYLKLRGHERSSAWSVH
ncbi:MAG: hypothetical protein WAK90_00645, partial [Pseudolabrys sp.]